MKMINFFLVFFFLHKCFVRVELKKLARNSVKFKGNSERSRTEAVPASLEQQANNPNAKDKNQKNVRLMTRDIKSLQEILQSIRQWEMHSYEEMVWLLQFLNKSCAPYAHLYSIGSSVQNRELWVMALSGNPSLHEIGEPEVKIIANIHGNEGIGREVILHMIDSICSTIDSDRELNSLIHSTRIHFLPSINPDGAEMWRFHSKDGKNIGRLNGNGIDLNRNFPDQFFPSLHDPEPETLSLIKWMEEIPFMLSASLHDGAFVVTFPYDDSPSGQTKYSATPDDDIFRYLARLYSETHPEMHLSNMGNCARYSQHKKFIGGITNGAEWSSLSNTMQDYNYVKNSCFEITIEMSCAAFINSTNLPMLFHQNYPSLLSFIRQSLRGIKGIVTDEGGNPLPGVHISISDRKHDVKTANNGDYWRILLPGTYEVTARLKGYEPSTRIISVPNTIASWANFTLMKAQVDPSIIALGHVGAIQKSLNLMNFANDGRDAADGDLKDENNVSIESAEEYDSNRISGDFSELKKESTSQEILKLSRPVVLSDNQNFQPKLPALKFEEQKTTKSDAPADIQQMPEKPRIGASISCSIPGREMPLQGILRWTGSIPQLASKTNMQKDLRVLGIELFDSDPLATDGTFLGKKYFSTDANHAYFVPETMCNRKTVQ